MRESYIRDKDKNRDQSITQVCVLLGIKPEPQACSTVESSPRL